MLSDRQLNFVREYCVDFNATKAYIRAGYSEGGASTGASLLLANPKIQTAVEAQKALVAQAATLNAAVVLREWTAIALADPRKLTTTWRGCCRHCYGIENRRQWTRGEYQSAFERAMRDELPAPEIEGGIGYEMKREPNPDCPECAGRGVVHTYVADMEKLDPVTARLYAGVKQTKDGIEVKTRDQDAALLYLAKYLGMVTEKREHSGPGGGPIQTQQVPVSEMSDEMLTAIALGLNPEAPLLEAEN